MSDRVALDTSALMMPVECGVRLFEELDRLVPAADPVVPSSVVAELDALSKGGGEEADAASVGRDLVERCSVVESGAGYADDAIVELAGDGRVDYVATNDRDLADRVRSRGVPVIGLRGRNKLAVTQP
ncbi:twitching motility protein PilT [Halobacteriales archaeon QS_8_69_26]|nr:MAG: twitching motility protein PilT [Halobacteriales archaeon QS_8_69_26]